MKLNTILEEIIDDDVSSFLFNIRLLFLEELTFKFLMIK